MIKRLLRMQKKQLEFITRTRWDASVNGDVTFVFAVIVNGLDVELLVMRWKDSKYLEVVTEK